ncbi:hypothetical protein VTN96DRAFT_790 [Rasamsonia emersonii]
MVTSQDHSIVSRGDVAGFTTRQLDTAASKRRRVPCSLSWGEAVTVLRRANREQGKDGQDQISTPPTAKVELVVEKLLVEEFPTVIHQQSEWWELLFIRTPVKKPNRLSVSTRAAGGSDNQRCCCKILALFASATREINPKWPESNARGRAGSKDGGKDAIDRQTMRRRKKEGSRGAGETRKKATREKGKREKKKSSITRARRVAWKVSRLEREQGPGPWEEGGRS